MRPLYCKNVDVKHRLHFERVKKNISEVALLNQPVDLFLGNKSVNSKEKLEFLVKNGLSLKE